ncbi:hypothetical protein D3C79_914970 [compost metagenome]
MRLEYLFQTLRGHPRPFIVNLQDEPGFAIQHPQVSALAILQGIVDHVAHTPAQRQRFTRIRRQRPTLKRYSAAGQIRLDQAIESVVEVNRLDVFVNVGVFHALQCAFYQHLQLVQVATELGLLLLVLK